MVPNQFDQDFFVVIGDDGRVVITFIDFSKSRHCVQQVVQVFNRYKSQCRWLFVAFVHVEQHATGPSRIDTFEKVIDLRLDHELHLTKPGSVHQIVDVSHRVVQIGNRNHCRRLRALSRDRCTGQYRQRQASRHNG